MAEMETGLAPKKKRKKKKQSLFKSIVTGLIPWKGDSPMEVFRKIIFIASLVIFVVAVVVLAGNMLRYADLDQNVGTESDGSEAAANAYIIDLKNQTPTQAQIEQLPEGTINEEYAALYEANNDFIGWVNIPGTNVDYPVMQAEDNEYYLHKDFDGNDLFAGTIFTDFEGRFGPNEMPNNTILYGHNMLYKYQFSALSNYPKDIEFLRMSPVINFNTLYQDNKYKIFAVFKVNTNSEHGEVFNYINYVYFKNQSEFYEYVCEAMDRSLYETGVDVEYGDELLTLSTCDASTGFDDMRLVIVARRVRDNESPEVDTSKFKRKQSVKYFDAYYEVYGNTWKGRTWDVSLFKGMEEYLRENGLWDEPEE
ncbi:MAG: class B sortase [Oscillospiraceae bacterium]